MSASAIELPNSLPQPGALPRHGSKVHKTSSSNKKNKKKKKLVDIPKVCPPEARSPSPAVNGGNNKRRPMLTIFTTQDIQQTTLNGTDSPAQCGGSPVTRLPPISRETESSTGLGSLTTRDAAKSFGPTGTVGKSELACVLPALRVPQTCRAPTTKKSVGFADDASIPPSCPPPKVDTIVNVEAKSNDGDAKADCNPAPPSQLPAIFGNLKMTRKMSLQLGLA